MTEQEIAEAKKKPVSLWHLQQFFNKIEGRYALAEGSTKSSDSSTEESDAVEIEDYMLDADGNAKSFNYSAANTYTYTGKSTNYDTYQVYTNGTYVQHALFKVVDTDIYIGYVVDATDETKYTYEGFYVAETLPLEAKDTFELGSYAVIHKLSSTNEDDSFNSKKATIFLDNANKVSRYAYIQDLTYGDILDADNIYLIAVNQYNTRAWVYVRDTGNTYKWQAVYKSSVDGGEAIVTALAAIVDCASKKYDPDVTYPDGSIGAELSSLAREIAQKGDPTDAQVESAVKEYLEQNASLIFTTAEKGFAFVDNDYNIGVLIDSEGIHAPNILEYTIVNS